MLGLLWASLSGPGPCWCRRSRRARRTSAGCATVPLVLCGGSRPTVCSGWIDWSRLARAVSLSLIAGNAGHLAGCCRAVAPERPCAGQFRPGQRLQEIAARFLPEDQVRRPAGAGELSDAARGRCRAQRTSSANWRRCSAPRRRACCSTPPAASRARPRYRGHHRRRSVAGAALQPAGTGSRAAEHEPGHQRGRLRAAPGRLESALRRVVRLSGAAAGRRAGRGICLRHNAARGLGPGMRWRAESRSASPTCAPARPMSPSGAFRRQRGGDPRQSDARRRLRRHLHRCHRLPPRRGGAQGHRRDARATGGRSAPPSWRAPSAEAERANRAKTRFLAAVSHDLAQPLNAAHLFTHALAQQLEHPQYRDAVDNIDGALGSAESLLAGLLDISRLDAGGMAPNVAGGSRSTCAASPGHRVRRAGAAKVACAALRAFARVGAQRSAAVAPRAAELPGQRGSLYQLRPHPAGLPTSWRRACRSRSGIPARASLKPTSS